MTQHAHANSSMHFPALATFSPVAVMVQSSAALLENGQPTLLSSTKQLMNIIAKHPYQHVSTVPVTAAAHPQAAHAGAIGFGSYWPSVAMNVPTKFYPAASVAASNIYATASHPTVPIHIPLPALLPSNLLSPSHLPLPLQPQPSATNLGVAVSAAALDQRPASSDFEEKKSRHDLLSTSSSAVSPFALYSSPSSPSQSLEAMSLSSLSSSSSPSSLPDEEMHLADTQEENSTLSNALGSAQLLPITGSNLNLKPEDGTRNFMFHPNNFLIEDYNIYATDAFGSMSPHTLVSTKSPEELLLQQQLPPLSITQSTPKESPHRLEQPEAKTDNMSDGAATLKTEHSPLPLAIIEQNASLESNLIYDFFTNPMAQMSATHLPVPQPLLSGRSGHSDDEFIFVEGEEDLP